MVDDGDGTDAHNGEVKGEMLHSQSSIQVLKNQNRKVTVMLPVTSLLFT